ncbi:MAG: hypothetical protein M0Q13_06080 [Methanothrix sp.]|jgi:hypothetical protein|nr:hypothetical protein [Methanothrix sp.]
MTELPFDPSVNSIPVINSIVTLAGIGQRMMMDIPDFIMTVDPLQGSVIQGGVITTIVAIESNHKYFRRYEKFVNLSISEPTSDIKISFSPDSERPLFDSIITIKTEPDSQIGDHEIIIKGCGSDGKEHSCKYRLNIKPDNLKLTSSSKSKPLKINEYTSPNSAIII